MKTIRNSAWDFILIILIIILYFLTSKNIIYSTIFPICAAIIGLYFFPFRLLYLIGTKPDLKNSLYFLISSLLIGTIIPVSAVYMYLDGDGSFRMIILALTIANLAFLLAYYILNKDRSLLAAHSALLLLTSSMLYL